MYWINLIIPGVILFPNLLFFWQAPSGTKDQWENEKPYILSIIEWVGRVGIILTPIFSPLEIESVGENMAVLVMGVFLILYYIAWIRYFAYEMEYEYLLLPLFGIPLPLVIAPFFFFLFASYPLHSIPLLVSTIIFGFSHIWIAIRSYRGIREDEPEDER